MRRLHRSEAGFSLAELLVSVVVAGFMLAAATSVGLIFLRTERYASETGQDMDAARAALESMRREIRQAEHVVLGSDGRTLTAWIDKNQDWAKDPDEEVTYRLVAVGGGRARLERVELNVAGQPTRLVAQRLMDEPVFAYDLPPQETRAVTIALTVQGTSREARAPFSAQTIVRLRNVS